ncbi:MAG: SDR family oxidoreductase, partial [Pontimonas sp.]
MNTETYSRRVLVTGASSGIGAATVRLLTTRGWSVIAVARRADRLETLRKETGCEVVVADVTSDADVRALAEHVASSGDISALVNNAGGAVGMDPIDEADPEDWARMYE